MENAKEIHIPIHRSLFYLVCILLPVQIGYHFWPSWAMVLGRRVDYLSPTLYLTDILIILLVFFWFTDLFTRRRGHVLGIMGKTLIHNTSTLIPLCIFVCVNIAFSKNIPVSMYQWVKVIEFVLFGFYIVKTKPLFRHVVSALSIAVLYSSVLTIVQFLLQRSVGGPLWVLGERTFFADTPGIAQISLCDFGGQSCGLFLRPYATFPHPNVLGGFLSITLPFLLFFILHTKERITGFVRQLFVSAFVLGIIAIFLTFGRSAWVSGSIGILFVLHNALRNSGNTFYKKNMNVIIGCVSLIAVIGMFFFSRNIQGSESVVVRGELNTAAFAMIGDNLLFGVGWGNFLTALPLYLSERTIYFLQPVHNIYLLAVAQLGVFGSLFIGLGIMYYGKLMKRTLSIYSVSLVLVLLLGIVDHYFLTLQSGQLLFATIIGLYFASIAPHTYSTT
jgi:hypothetical protein